MRVPAQDPTAGDRWRRHETLHDEIRGLIDHAVRHVLSVRGEVASVHGTDGSSGMHCWIVFAA